ncbi:MAG: hypothetical protein ABIE94_05620 [archaeon]
MTKISVKDTDRIIKELCDLVEADAKLKTKLEDATSWKTRWSCLESYVTEHLVDFGLTPVTFQSLWIRDRFFYEMQQSTSLDYGFCNHFIPAFRARTESVVTDNLKLDMDNKCTYGNAEPVMTTCSGTERDICVFLHPEYRQPGMFFPDEDTNRAREPEKPEVH